MNQIIVLGNIYDETNTFCSNGRVYSGGGIAPSIGASHFGTERYVLETRKLGYICSFSTGVTDEFFHASINVCHAIVSNRHDKAILERTWKKSQMPTLSK